LAKGKQSGESDPGRGRERGRLGNQILRSFPPAAMEALAPAVE
jgi:hypothetical protein